MDDSGPDEALSEVRQRLARLKELHEDFAAAVAVLQDAGAPDQVQLARLKKRKLQLKDQIVRMESALTPDLIA